MIFLENNLATEECAATNTSQIARKMLLMTFCFFSYFLNNKKFIIFHLPYILLCILSMYFVLPKPLQNSSKTTSAVTHHSASPAAVTAPPAAATAPPAAVAAAAAPLRRHRCRFGLADLTWVWSKVVVA